MAYVTSEELARNLQLLHRCPSCRWQGNGSDGVIVKDAPICCPRCGERVVQASVWLDGVNGKPDDSLLKRVQVGLDYSSKHGPTVPVSLSQNDVRELLRRCRHHTEVEKLICDLWEYTRGSTEKMTAEEAAAEGETFYGIYIRVQEEKHE